MHKSEFSVAVPETLDRDLKHFLIREDGQEDLAFALWYPSRGRKRTTALLQTVLYPEDDERTVHGNVSFNRNYFERTCQLAMREGAGIALLHSHLGPGWQDMSSDDIEAEHGLAGAVESLTELPLVGLTVG